MSLWEDYSDRLDDEYGDIIATCKRCGEEDLHWEMTDEGWRLFNEDGTRHFCHPPSADDFEVLDVL